LLALGTTHGFLRVASFTTAEILELGGKFRDVDLLALNLDEAAAIAALPARAADAEEVVAAALRRLRSGAPEPRLSVTAGPAGSWSWDGATLAHLPALTVSLASTAGAGDAFLAGLLVGLESGLGMAQMQQLGTLVAGLAVTSPHTIHPELDLASLRALAGAVAPPGTRWDPRVLALLDDAASLPDQDGTAAPAGR
jgi:sugar/nucleoside kinase (ribokinase family)